MNGITMMQKTCLIRLEEMLIKTLETLIEMVYLREEAEVEEEEVEEERVEKGIKRRREEEEGEKIK